MALIKNYGDFSIHKLNLSREWKGKELIVTYKYVCRVKKTGKDVFECDTYDEAMEYCKEKSHITIDSRVNDYPQRKNIELQILLDIKSILDANIPALIDENNLVLTDRINSVEQAQEVLKKLDQIVNHKSIVVF